MDVLYCKIVSHLLTVSVQYEMLSQLIAAEQRLQTPFALAADLTGIGTQQSVHQVS